MFGRLWSQPIAGRRRASSRPQRAPRTPTASPVPTLRDDAAHAADFATHPNKGWFTEWWYFNVRDPKSGVALLGVYAASPYGGGGAFGTMVWVDGAPPIDTMDMFAWSQVKTSPERADVRLGPNRIEVIDEDTYRIVGASNDGQVSWDLTLSRVAGAGPAWLLDDAQGPLEGEVGYWMSWLPFARAKGTVTVGGTPHVLEDASAYHDHNWGVWLSPARNWQWLQCSSVEERIALDLGYSDGFDPARVAILQLEGRAFEFESGGIDLPTYGGFRPWPNTPWKYPERATTTLIDRQGKVRVEVEWSAPTSATKPMFTQIVLFEQHVAVTLRVSERGADGAWQAPRTFPIDGIAEWSDSYVDAWQTGEGMVGAYVAEATVFGGGISGLTAAHELSERGFAVTVVEPEEALDSAGVRGMAIGGMARSHFARVPRSGAAAVNQPAGRPTPDARNDRWRSPEIGFHFDSSSLEDGAELAIADAARAFLETYVEQGYRLRVSGSASPGEKEPHALAARRAETVREHLVHRGVAEESILLAERGDGEPRVVVALEDHVLPGEHGFRFFPSYYRHVTDTMSRIPVYDHDGRATDRRVLDNLKPSTERLMLRSGRRPSASPVGTSTPLQMLRQLVATLNDDDYDPRDFLQMAIRLSRYLATCPERRLPLEDMSWWNYLLGFSPKTNCYLYRYSNAFAKDSVASGRVLAAFDWTQGDARTNGSTFVQLFDAVPGTSPSSFNGMLNGPTTDAWFVHWRRFLGERGVRFVSGALERLDVEPVDGKDTLVAWVKLPGKRAPEPWRGRTGQPHYVVVATDAPTAERASEPLPKVGVPKGLVGYTTRFDGKPRDPYRNPGLAPNDRFQTLTGIQYFFDQGFAIGDGAYSLDAPWSLTTVSVQRIWSRTPFMARDGYAGMLTVDIGDFKVPAGPTQQTAWDSSRERIGEQVWTQLSNDLRMAPLGPSPMRLPKPRWFHLDDNIEFGDRDGRKNVVVRNASPYLVPILKDWRERPGPAPFDPNVPDATAAPPQAPGVWTAPHGGYPVHWDSLVYAGIYLKTFTRMTTMESANESARHAVNAIIDHYNAHHGATVPPPSPPQPHHADPTELEADQVVAQFIGDYCGIWNMERYEPPGFDALKGLDQILFDLGLPHVFDLLGVEVIPSILSHLFPYRGDCAPWKVAPIPLDPKPGKLCPPFIGQTIGNALGKLRGRLRGGKKVP